MSDFIDILKKIQEDYGEEPFQNGQKIHAILLDLARDKTRDRLLARHFVEAGGYNVLKKSTKANLTHATTSIIHSLRENFSLEANAAAWITHLFTVVMGLSSEPWGSAPGEARRASPPARGLAPLTPNILHEGFVEQPYMGGAVAIGMTHTLALIMDGTVLAHGRNEFLQCDLDGWRQIKAVAAGDAHSVGLMVNGDVVAVGRNDHDQCDVGAFSDIASIYAFGNDTICVGQNGRVSACGKSKLDLSHFEQIRSIAWHPEGVYGIRHDGRVMMSSPGWEEEDWALALSDVVQIISTYVMGSYALTSGGRVYKMGEPDSYFAHLRDIAAITDLTDGFAVLRKDGMVRILPYTRNTPRKASESDDWRDIVAIYGKYKRLIGLTSEGRLHATCTDPDWLKRNGSLDFLQNWYPVGNSFPSKEHLANE